MQRLFIFISFIFLFGCSSIKESVDVFGALEGTKGINFGMTQEEVCKKIKQIYKEYEIIEIRPDKLELTESFRIRTFLFKNGKLDSILGEYVYGFISRKAFEEKIPNGGNVLDELIAQGLIGAVSPQKIYFKNKEQIKDYLKLHHMELQDAVMEIIDNANSY